MRLQLLKACPNMLRNGTQQNKVLYTKEHRIACICILYPFEVHSFDDSGHIFSVAISLFLLDKEEIIYVLYSSRFPFHHFAILNWNVPDAEASLD